MNRAMDPSPFQSVLAVMKKGMAAKIKRLVHSQWIPTMFPKEFLEKLPWHVIFAEVCFLYYQ